MNGPDVAFGPPQFGAARPPARDEKLLAVGPLRDLPFHSTDDLLHVFHRLRC